MSSDASEAVIPRGAIACAHDTGLHTRTHILDRIPRPRGITKIKMGLARDGYISVT